MKASKAFRNTIFIVAGSTFLILIVSIIVVVVVASQPIKVPPPEHSSAAAMSLAKKYLGAIENGDAAAARAMDKDSFGASTDGVDNVTFTTGADLKGATQRIHDVTYHLGGNNGDESWVNTTYQLAGKTYKSQVSFTWDSAAKRWHLQYSIANLVSVYSYTTAIDQVPLPFTLGDVKSAAPTPGDDGEGADGAYYSYLVYPAVYPLTVTINPATLADPSRSTTTTLLVPPDPYKGGDAGFKLAAPAS